MDQLQRPPKLLAFIRTRSVVFTAMSRPDMIQRTKVRHTQVGQSHKTLPRGGTADARVVIIGAAGDLHRALTHPALQAGRFSAVATYAIDVEVGLPDESRNRVEAMFDRHEADAIVIAGPVGPSVAAWATDVAVAHGCPAWAVMPTEIPVGSTPQVVGSAHAMLLRITDDQRRPAVLVAKRIIDVVGGFAGILVSTPILLFIAALVWMESRGNPFFRHVRIGRGGRPFSCLKLRTMHVDAQAQLAADRHLSDLYRRNGYKIPEAHDPRVTRLGRLLRRASLDELPQFWNVLVGHMSLVGPRPVVPDELDEYTGVRRRLLLTVRPGLTGAWAVSGRHAIGYPERAEMELRYVRSWSLFGDLKILLKTIAAVFHY